LDAFVAPLDFLPANDDDIAHRVPLLVCDHDEAVVALKAWQDASCWFASRNKTTATAAACDKLLVGNTIAAATGILAMNSLLAADPA